MLDGEPIIQYNILCTDPLWKPEGGIKLWKLVSNEKQVWLRGEPGAAPPIPMKNQDDIIMGLSSFIGLWESLAERDPSGSYVRSHNDLILYWKGVRDALQMPPPPLVASLVNGFWQATRIQRQDNVPLSNDGTLREVCRGRALHRYNWRATSSLVSSYTRCLQGFICSGDETNNEASLGCARCLGSSIDVQ
jgi:hypothetical protein